MSTTNNALQIIKKRLESNPELRSAYLKEKKNYQIALKIREYRKASKLTQKELALKIGTKQSVISRLENAEYEGHSLAILNKIAAALKRKIEDFLEEENGNPMILTFHNPHIFEKAASFKWNQNQISVKCKHAR